ncbi:D-amino-acid oxidase [Wickerhamiella sorbophila]|uniref:D-amino-acid oxidase n=1 Tax=Wickerhamiella sorbophila TaxID=45607 RepID=A0A2T0FIF1_9ASCO|nr:D-amino-acid oxidase [Wickerhamiella sorbophila]PRT54746.1 D-amino-acid oxidase [Wickerhamiella sorbophila]
MSEIVIVGSGIIGLYTALILCRCELATKITVVAKWLPGDNSIEYTSPIAGGNFSSISAADPAALEYDRLSFLYLDEIFKNYGREAGLARLKTTEFWRQKPPAAKIESLKSYVPDFEIIEDKEVLKSKDASFGVRYTTYNFYCPHFLKFLYNKLRDHGVTFLRRELSHITDAASAKTEVIFNCTGNGAATIGGVSDSKCMPIRGQIVLIRAPHINENFGLLSEDREPIYVIPRPFSGGQVVLGGYYQKGDSTPDTFGYQSAAIIDKTTRYFPQLLAKGPLDVIVEKAGLRPGREGGARIEKETINGKTVIHNYGAGGTGFQSGLGMALKAIELYLPSPRL